MRKATIWHIIKLCFGAFRLSFDIVISSLIPQLKNEREILSKQL